MIIVAPASSSLPPKNAVAEYEALVDFVTDDQVMFFCPRNEDGALSIAGEAGSVDVRKVIVHVSKGSCFYDDYSSECRVLTHGRWVVSISHLMPSVTFDGDPPVKLQYSSGKGGDTVVLDASSGVLSTLFFQYNEAKMNHRWWPVGRRTLTWAVGLPPTQQALPNGFGAGVLMRAEFVLVHTATLHDIEYPTICGAFSFVGGGWGAVLAGMGVFCLVLNQCLARYVDARNWVAPRDQ